jgi:hypothetical protein
MNCNVIKQMHWQRFLCWFAGFWEGEGWFYMPNNGLGSKGVRFGVGQTNQEIIEAICDKFGVGVFKERKNQVLKGWKRFWIWEVSSKRDIYSIVIQLYPYLTFRKDYVKKRLINLSKYEMGGYWDKNENEIIGKNIDKEIKELMSLLPSRTRQAIEMKRFFIKKDNCNEQIIQSTSH